MKNNQINSGNVENVEANRTINYNFENGFLGKGKGLKRQIKVESLDATLRDGIIRWGGIEKFEHETLDNLIDIYQNKKEKNGKDYNDELFILYHAFLKLGIDILNKELKFDFEGYIANHDGYNVTAEMKAVDLTKVDERALMCMTGSLVFCYDDYENDEDVYRLELKRRGVITTNKNDEDVWDENIDDNYCFILGDGSYFNELDEVIEAITKGSN